MENDIKSLRRQLLKTEIEEQGLAVVAKKAGKPDRQINDMAAGRKTFGDKIARAIGPLIRPDLAPDWLLSPSPNVKKAPATTQLPDSPTQQDAVPEGAGMPHYQGNLYELLAKRCGEGCCAAPFAVFKRFFAAGA